MTLQLLNLEYIYIYKLNFKIYYQAYFVMIPEVSYGDKKKQLKLYTERDNGKNLKNQSFKVKRKSQPPALK